jgi:thiol-disulfide isomerase/thioredoxin
MKTLMLLFALIGTVRYCSKPKEFNMPAQNTNRQKLELAIQPDLQSKDSIQKILAGKFKESIAAEYNGYKPDSSVMTELRKYWNNAITVKVIGGNWCSDTRRELPRLCRVLDGVGANADGFGYYKVNKDKQPLSQDFSAEYPVKKVPSVFVFSDGKPIGQIIETPSKSWESDLLKLLIPLNRKLR